MPGPIPCPEPDLAQLYLETMTEKERKAYEIAKDHLGMSFQLEKSLGYIQFVKEYKASQQSTK
jgi:hypothetical protein